MATKPEIRALLDELFREARRGPPTVPARKKIRRKLRALGHKGGLRGTTPDEAAGK